jgi:two-component system nitrate/nitrite response regulator NarL
MLKRRLILVGESQLSREGLRQILASDSMIIVDSIARLPEVFPLIRADVDVTDLILFIASENREQDWDTVREITAEFPEIAIAVLADDCDRTSYNAAVAAGVRGFLPNSISGAGLGLSLQLIALGENLTACPAALAKPQNTAATIANIGRPSELRAPLSERETEILGCLEDGLPNKVIARKLSMAEATVKVHIKAILRKIDVDNRTQAAVWAMTRKQTAQTYSALDRSFRDVV